jgi:hypothetical protein
VSTGTGAVRRATAAVALAMAAVAGGGCASDGVKREWVIEHPLGCRLDEHRLVRDTLYFGRSIPGGGEVDDAAWRAFEADVLAPAFPDGYTVLDASGHWRDAAGAAVAEASRVVLIVHADDGATEQRVRDVVARYRARFRQESVLRERGAVCATF